MAVSTKTDGKKEIPHGVWTKCKKCEQIIFKKELDTNYKICPKCGYYFRLGAYERIKMLTEPQSFVEYYQDMTPVDRGNDWAFADRLDGVGCSSFPKWAGLDDADDDALHQRIVLRVFLLPGRAELCVDHPEKGFEVRRL